MAMIYVVLDEVPYEGYGAPKAAFTSQEKAQAFADKLNKEEKRVYDPFEVLEVELHD